MTATRDHRDFLNDMVLACRSIIRFAEGMTLDGYLADEKTRYAVMRAYEILGEAVTAPARVAEVGQSRHSMDDNGRCATIVSCTAIAASRH